MKSISGIPDQFWKDYMYVNMNIRFEFEFAQVNFRALSNSKQLALLI